MSTKVRNKSNDVCRIWWTIAEFCLSCRDFRENHAKCCEHLCFDWFLFRLVASCLGFACQMNTYPESRFIQESVRAISFGGAQPAWPRGRPSQALLSRRLGIAPGILSHSREGLPYFWDLLSCCFRFGDDSGRL